MKPVPRITRTCLHCGAEFAFRLSPSRINKGKFCTKSCGAAFNQTKHGNSKSTAYNSWASAIQRCTNPNHPKYKKYGGAGITIHPEWRESFAAFLRDLGQRPKGTTLDRIDNDGNYEPGNCRWSSPAEQQRNRQKNVYYEAFGKRLCITDWAKEVGTDAGTIKYRIQSGWPLEEALTFKPHKRPKTKKVLSQQHAC